MNCGPMLFLVSMTEVLWFLLTQVVARCVRLRPSHNPSGRGFESHPPVPYQTISVHYPSRVDPSKIKRSRFRLVRSFVILTGLIKVLISDDESTTSRAFCLHARCRLGSRPSRQDQEVHRQHPKRPHSVYKLSTTTYTESVSQAQELLSVDTPTKLRPSLSASAGRALVPVQRIRRSRARNHRSRRRYHRCTPGPRFWRLQADVPGMSRAG
jgi:hypothetical protein